MQISISQKEPKEFLEHIYKTTNWQDNFPSMRRCDAEALLALASLKTTALRS